MDFINLTEQLKIELTKLKDIFLLAEKPDNKRDPAFFAHVKEQTTPLFAMKDEWEQAINTLIQERRVNVHPQQVVSTKENMELLFMHSYYIDVKKQRYMELNKSVFYVFDLALESLKEK